MSRRSTPSRKRNKAAYDAGAPFSVSSVKCNALQMGITPVYPDASAYGFWEATNYSQASPGVVSETKTVKIVNDGQGTGWVDQLPLSGHSFWNTGTGFIEPEFEGDAYVFELRLRARNDYNAGGGAAGKLELSIIIPTVNIIIPCGIFTFVKGTGEHNFSKTTFILCRNSWKQYGAEVFVKSELGNTFIEKVGIGIARIHRARGIS